MRASAVAILVAATFALLATVSAIVGTDVSAVNSDGVH